MPQVTQRLMGHNCFALSVFSLVLSSACHNFYCEQMKCTKTICNMLKYACAAYCSYIFSEYAKIPCACVCIAYVNQLIGTDYNFLGFLGQLMGLMGCGKEWQYTEKQEKRVLFWQKKLSKAKRLYSSAASMEFPLSSHRASINIILHYTL